jgi:hypothetical protein
MNRQLRKIIIFYFGIYTRLCLIALINCLLRLSALALFSDITAHMAAGSQPISVICKIKQTMAEMILPLKKKDRKGTSMANSIGILFTDVKRYNFLSCLLFTLANLLAYLRGRSFSIFGI